MGNPRSKHKLKVISEAIQRDMDRRHDIWEKPIEKPETVLADLSVQWILVNNHSDVNPGRLFFTQECDAKRYVAAIRGDHVESRDLQNAANPITHIKKYWVVGIEDFLTQHIVRSTPPELRKKRIIDNNNESSVMQRIDAKFAAMDSGQTADDNGKAPRSVERC